MKDSRVSTMEALHLAKELPIRVPFVLEGRNTEVHHWCHDNCVGQYHVFGNVILFENEDDMVLFKLRWL